MTDSLMLRLLAQFCFEVLLYIFDTPFANTEQNEGGGKEQ